MGQTVKSDLEFVWGAYEAGIRELRRLQGRQHLPRHLSSKRREALKKALQVHGRKTVALACRNLVLSAWHRGQDGSKREYLDVSYALRRVEDYADMCLGPWLEFKARLNEEINGDNGLRKAPQSAIFKRKGDQR